MPDIQLCEDCAHVAQGDDWTIVDQEIAKRVERWQVAYTARPAYDTDSGHGVTTSGTACHCCGTRQTGPRYTFRVAHIYRIDWLNRVMAPGVSHGRLICGPTANGTYVLRLDGRRHEVGRASVLIQRGPKSEFTAG